MNNYNIYILNILNNKSRCVNDILKEFNNTTKEKVNITYTDIYLALDELYENNYVTFITKKNIRVYSITELGKEVLNKQSVDLSNISNSKVKDYIDQKFNKIAKYEDAIELKNDLYNNLANNNSDNSIELIGNVDELVKKYHKKHNKLRKRIKLPSYRLSEELINAISHGFGALFSIIAFLLCLPKVSSIQSFFAIFIYTFSSFILYLISCLYHSLKRNNAKRVFRIIDHCSIFLLIAGTYTPIVLLKFPSLVGWIIFFFVWILAIIGVVLNSINMEKYKVISMVLYLVMGWCIIVNIKILFENMNIYGVYYILTGGIIYTLGTIFYGFGKNKPFMHSVFHLFCLIASIFFFLAIYCYVL